MEPNHYERDERIVARTLVLYRSSESAGDYQTTVPLDQRFKWVVEGFTPLSPTQATVSLIGIGPYYPAKEDLEQTS